MAYENYFQPFSLPTAADLSSSMGCAVTVNGSGLLALTAAGAMPDGVLNNPDATSGAQGRFNWDGVLKLRSGAAIAIGDLLVVGANGKFIKGVTSTNVRVAKALSVADAADEFVTAFFRLGVFGVVP